MIPPWDEVLLVLVAQVAGQHGQLAPDAAVGVVVVEGVERLDPAAGGAEDAGVHVARVQPLPEQRARPPRGHESRQSTAPAPGTGVIPGRPRSCAGAGGPRAVRVAARSRRVAARRPAAPAGGADWSARSRPIRARPGPATAGRGGGAVRASASSRVAACAGDPRPRARPRGGARTRSRRGPGTVAGVWSSGMSVIAAVTVPVIPESSQRPPIFFNCTSIR